MSIDEPTPSEPTPLYKALQDTALDAYGSLLAGPLAEKAATSFADEANAMLEGLIAEHTQTLRDRIDAQLSGISVGKGPKRKAIKAPAPDGAANGAMNGATHGATNGASDGAEAAPAESKPAKASPSKAGAAKTVEAKSPRGRKKTSPRNGARA